MYDSVLVHAINFENKLEMYIMIIVIRTWLGVLFLK